MKTKKIIKPRPAIKRRTSIKYIIGDPKAKLWFSTWTNTGPLITFDQSKALIFKSKKDAERSLGYHALFKNFVLIPVKVKPNETNL